VTGNAPIVIDVHYLLPVRILKSLEFWVNPIVFGQVAGAAIKVLGGQRFGVSVMQEFNRRFFKFAKHGH
jgi:hypothetical protein